MNKQEAIKVAARLQNGLAALEAKIHAAGPDDQIVIDDTRSTIQVHILPPLPSARPSAAVAPAPAPCNDCHRLTTDPTGLCARHRSFR